MKHFQYTSHVSRTGVKFGQLTILSLVLALSSCNKEGFYEKAYLGEAATPETTSGFDGGGEEGGSSEGNNTSGSSTGGSTDGSATGGSSTGGTTGSTVGGSSTGGTTGGTTGSTTSGSTTGTTTSGGSTTVGSTTGSTVGGSTTGSTVGGTTGGSSTGGTTGVSYQSVTEDFKQSAKQTKKLDVLWIVDNSGSMADEQDSLGRNFDSFITKFIDQDVDFKMAITTTDTSSSTKRGAMVSGSDTKLTSAKAHEDEAKFMDDFKKLVQVGIKGSGSERGLEASDYFMQRHASGWMRSDAYLAVVIISDEEDQSPKTPAQYWNTLKGYKSTAGLAKVYTIVDKTKSNVGSGIATGYERYAALATSSAGIVGDIREDFADILSDMGTAIINLLDSFALAHKPIDGSLIVKVNGVVTTAYSYDESSRSIKFDQGHIPPVNATIKVTYLK